MMSAVLSCVSLASECNLTQAQSYTVSYTIPEQSVYTKHMVVLRYYQNWGDGSTTGWQKPINPPIVTLNAETFPTHPQFSYSSPNYEIGGMGLGYDQYAQYWATFFIDTDISNATLNITGTFEQVAYMSATLYSSNSPNSWEPDPAVEYLSTQKSLFDREMWPTEENCNPYIQGNPSVFAYASPPDKAQGKFTSTMPLILISQIDPLQNVHTNFNTPSTGKVGLFRLDKEMSAKAVAEDIASDGCSRAYLFARLNPDHNVAILRIKVPTTFISDSNPRKVFGKYQTRYLSVGAHYYHASDIRLNHPLHFPQFWSVNSQMLNRYKDKKGYAYVFFAPDDFVEKIAKEQNTPETEPPVIGWGKYKGFLLGEPSYAIIIRYRDPDPSWKGSPENATCYKNNTELKPVGFKELGIYTPHVFSGTLDEFFNSGEIGVVKKTQAWPE